MSDKFVLWAERSLSAHVTSFWIENLAELGKFEDEPFAYYEVIPTGNESMAIKWSVTLDNFERFGAAETANQAREKILTALAEGGLEFRSLPQYALSKVRGMFTDGRKYILQRFNLNSLLPSDTWFISQDRENSVIKRISVYHVESGTVEWFHYESDNRTQLDHVAFTRQFLSRLHPELLGTEEVAEWIGWDKRKVASYWRQRRFVFPDLFIGGQPSWNDEKQQWEGGGRPLWKPETIERWKENPGK